MAIQFPSNIQLNTKKPLDDRQVVANEAARLALRYPYDGLIVFQEDNQKLYIANRVANAAKAANENYEWKELVIDASVIHGYYLNNKFYTDATYTTEIVGSVEKVYVDDNSNGDKVYIYNRKFGETTYHFICINPLIPDASDQVKGIMKLYDTLGQNTDGTMTQRIISKELNDKFEMLVDEDEETIVFGHDLY